MKNITAGFFLLSVSGMSHSNPSDESHYSQQTFEYNQASRGSFVVVGRDISDDNCDFFTIQSAINSGATEVRIATETYSESLRIDDRSVDLLGGYSTCTQAVNTNGFSPSEIAVINAENGNSTDAGITILGNSSRHQVTLRNLKVEEGKGGMGLTRGGGISTTGADLALNLLNVELFNNEGILGGGLSVFNGNTDVNAVNLLVRNNQANEGGGIYCFGNEVSIVLSDVNGALRSGIRTNLATDGNGGGIYMQNGCQLTTYTGTSASSGSDLRGISFNEASGGHGGGIAIDSGSQLFLIGTEVCNGSTCIGNNNHPININNNEAGPDVTGFGVGGGIFAEDTNTQVTAKNIKISSNLSQRNAGGVYIGGNASLTIQQVPLPCWSTDLCNQIDSNRSGQSGGGLFATSTATIDITQTHFKNNRANNGTAAFFWLGATDIPAKIFSSIISGNGDNGSGNYQDNNAIYSASDLDISFSTIADNQVQNQAFFQSSSSNTNSLQLFASIIHSPGVTIYGSEGNGSSLAANCLLVHEDSSFSGNNIVVENPDFIDRNNEDYHIAGSSPAIDMCASEALNSQLLKGGVTIFDIDDDLRGVDDPTIPNIDGPYDAGADEVYNNDLIFADGFE